MPPSARAWFAYKYATTASKHFHQRISFSFANAGHPDGDPCKRETKASGERVNSRYNPRFPGDPEMTKAFPVPVRVKYSCAKCPAYCCSYPEIEATPRDIERLARQFGLDYRQAEERFTKYDAAEKVRLLRHRKDRIFDSVCVLLDQETRRCTAYGRVPRSAASIPTARTAATTNFLKFERAHQDDPEFIAPDVG